MRWLFLLMPELFLLADCNRRTTGKPQIITWSGDIDSLGNVTVQLPPPSSSNASSTVTEGTSSLPSSSLFRVGEKAQCIADTPSESKQRINAAIERNLDGSFGIVCAECAFSYLAHTIQFCHHTRNNITCLVFRDSEIETDEQEPMP
ncbi:hypothetical protein PRIPAC_96954 [Pristionchus pacificus]|uniref:Ground-like domain-containing protein n=1 Tax=Pristionchus pacificus TaxID=54126 RepID=A0A2A6D258_PRIPA|nr:hypothetical protein PRIPAC_96954 [Pristionchus pacificus]|eukprot:PDM84470.1 hypothetical protein PRIPAC_33493 [Pristionchus pacificus]